jgi:5'-3' exonuclease
MGIPKFFGSWLKRRASSFPGVLQNNVPANVSSLFIDMNSIIHMAAQITYSYGEHFNEKRVELIKNIPSDALELQMFHVLGTKLLEIIHQVHPQINLVLAVDGVAPQAKIVQQKQRRFLSEPTTFFDPALITPGTDFMNRLDEYLRRWIARNEYFLPPKVFYSSHLVPGEGEHKIMDLIREGKIKGEGAHVIYGLDADFIMLALLSPLSDMFLMREDIMDVVNVENLKIMIKKIMKTSSSIMDFVLIVFLHGNDFLPREPSLEDTLTGIDTLINVYQKLNVSLTIRNEIILDHLNEYFRLLSLEEPNLIQQQAKKEFKYPSRMIEAAVDKERNINFKIFRDMWYTIALNDIGVNIKNVKDDEIKEKIFSICLEYIKGMQWILYYYTQGTFFVDPYWFYPFFHSPLFIDLYQSEIKNIPSLRTNVDPENYINVSQQLVAVSPRINVLPKNLRKYFKKQEYRIERDGKNFDYEGIVVTKFIDVREIKIAEKDLIKRDNLVMIFREPKKQLEVDRVKKFYEFIDRKKNELCKKKR